MSVNYKLIKSNGEIVFDQKVESKDSFVDTMRAARSELNARLTQLIENDSSAEPEVKEDDYDSAGSED